MKFCPKCRQFKDKTGFSSGYCPDCFKLYKAIWNGEQQGKVRGIKLEAIKRYGGKCSRCGNPDENVLVIYPPGPHGESALLYDLRQKKWPDTHIVTCRNCLVYVRRGDT